MPKNQPPVPGDPALPTGEIVLYQTEDGRTRVECRFVDETLWLSQALIAELFQKDIRTVNEHLQNIYQEGEIEEQATIRKFRIVRREGPREVEREIEHYNLDAILAIGYRVRSERGTQFRRWATERLSEYLVKGFTLDDLRLKNPPGAGAGVPDYFDDLLERIRDIRASEKRMYLRVREIFSLAGDYDPGRKETMEFFQIIQNRLHFAATGQTAPELIAARADHSKPNMGLTSWKGGVVRKADSSSRITSADSSNARAMASASPGSRAAASSRATWSSRSACGLIQPSWSACWISFSAAGSESWWSSDWTAPGIQISQNWLRRPSRPMTRFEIGEVLLATSIGDVLRQLRVPVLPGNPAPSHHLAEGQPIHLRKFGGFAKRKQIAPWAGATFARGKTTLPLELQPWGTKIVVIDSK